MHLTACIPIVTAPTRFGAGLARHQYGMHHAAFDPLSDI